MKNLDTVKNQIAKIQAEKKQQFLNNLILKNIKGGKGDSISCPPPCCH